MEALKTSQQLSKETLTTIFNKLKEIYGYNELDPNRKNELVALIDKYGYLPYSHIRALNELTPAETIAGIETKLGLNRTYLDGNFVFKDLSPVKRAGFKDSNWIKTEQHNIKLINLAALGDGNTSSETAKFIDWLKQLLILPAGDVSSKVLSTTMYIIPFHPREFGCAYLPTGSEVSAALEDSFVKENIGLDAKVQVQTFLALAQLAGHPIMYDVLPQTGRFSKTVIAQPYIARWFDVKELISNLENDLEEISQKLEAEFNLEEIETSKYLIKKMLKGSPCGNISQNLEFVIEKINLLLDEKRAFYSNKMLEKQSQETIVDRVSNIIKEVANKEIYCEEDIENHGMIIGKLISEGLWPAPGGAWCSSGVPVFDTMSEGASYPLFKHYDYLGNDVSHFANLDCQTPYFFVHFENSEINQKVVDFYVEFLKKLQKDYNFDGFRVDHIDHIVDSFSEDENGNPISYRAPRIVLSRANSEMKKEVEHFATLAEYMLWDNFFKEYHQDMNFDVLWGSDIISQYQKTPAKIIYENMELAEYNQKLSSKLSILKTYNNQDGEFRAINQYPGQLGEQGALFKWFKFKFLPSGKKCQRPVLYVDGDESFTKTGTESVIGSEESLKRANDQYFFNKFIAINNFALKNELTKHGVSEIQDANVDKSGFVSWYIKNSKDEERLFVVANENAPTEVVTEDNEDGSSKIVNKIGEDVLNKNVTVPEGFEVCSQIIFDGTSPDYKEIMFNENQKTLYFECIKPSEFFVYLIKKQ